ncbi:MAG: ArsA family ATPase [Myxococcota bacterium]
MRVLLHTGKGGVGKTSLSAAAALGAVQHGHRVFLLSTDSAHSLGDALGEAVGPAPIEIVEGLVAQEVDALTELDRSWSSIQDWLRELLQSETDDMIAEELLVFPGMEELVALRAIREVEASGEYDVCVVDCAPTGSTLRMLRFPDVLRIFMENFFDWKRKVARAIRPVAATLGAGAYVPSDEVFAAFERLYREVEDVRSILLDTDRTSARLVVNPARVVIDETRRSFAYLSLYGVATDAVLVNRVLPPEAAAGYFARWAQRERAELEEIEESFPVPQFRVPLHSTEPIGVEALRELAAETYGDRDPATLFTRARPIRLSKRDGATVMEIDLVHASTDELDLAIHGDQLLVRVRDARRRIALPDSVAGRSIAAAKLNEGVLEVVFEE